TGTPRCRSGVSGRQKKIFCLFCHNRTLEYGRSICLMFSFWAGRFVALGKSGLFGVCDAVRLEIDKKSRSLPQAMLLTTQSQKNPVKANFPRRRACRVQGGAL